MEQTGGMSPDVSSGQGVTAPSEASGQVNTQQNSSGNQSSGLTPEMIAELQNRTVHFNQKITEQGQMLSEFQKQLQIAQQREEQTRQAMAAALGLSQPQQEVDLLTQLVQNPDSLKDLIEQQVQQKLSPLQQQLQSREVGEYLYSQGTEKTRLEQSLTGLVGKEVADKILDISSYLPAQTLQNYQRLQNDPTLTADQKQAMNQQINTELSQVLQSMGGYEGIVATQLGRQFLSNPDALLRSAMQIAQQNQFQAARGVTNGNYSNSASNQGGGFSISSEMMYR